MAPTIAAVTKTVKPDTPQIRAAVSVEVDEASRTLQFIASDESNDRYGDVIRVAGWDTAAFQKNPVFLWAHDSSQLPIGQVTEITKAGTQLLARVKFLAEGTYAFADTVWKIVVAGALRAVSVGFMPKEYQPMYEPDEKGGEFIGYEFLKQELLELSLVPVPANSNAVAIGKGLGLSQTELRSLFLTRSDEARRIAEQARRVSDCADYRALANMEATLARANCSAVLGLAK